MKYKIQTDNIKQYKNVFLFRIERLSDGLVGGWIEDESNLSQDGKCFVYDDAIIYGEAKISGDAEVCDQSVVYGRSIITDNAMILGRSVIKNKAEVRDKAVILGSEVSREAIVGGYTIIKGRRCTETPTLIQNLFEDDITMFNDCFQIGMKRFILDKVMKDTGYFIRIAKELPKYRNCRVLFVQLIQKHKERSRGQSSL